MDGLPLKRIFKYLDNTRSIQLFQLLRFGAQFLTGLFLAKTSLSTTQIGVFDTFVFIATSVSFFWISGYINALLPLYPLKSDAEKPKFLFNAFLSVVLLNLLTCLALYLFSLRFAGI